MKFNIKQAKAAAEKEKQSQGSVSVTSANTVSSSTTSNVNTNKSISNTANGKELNFNKQRRESYETLMKESSTQLDGFYDKKNPFVKLLLLILAVISVLGIIYYVMTYMATMK